MLAGLRLVFATALLLATAESTDPAQTLRSAADSDGILIGSAARPYLFSEAAYTETLGREFKMIEPEDAMKWLALRPTADSFDFRDGDAVVRFAQAHNMKVRGHCLVWDHNNPDWLTHLNFTPAQMSRLLQEHITQVVRHYAGKVFAWDVVNEGLDEKGQLRDSPWYNQPGIGLAADNSAYIEQAFRWAHAADPQALLFYNEAEAEELSPKSDALFATLKDFKNRKVPIDGIGLQMHLSLPGPDMKSVAANMARLSGLGLQIHITELDVSIPVDASGAPAAKEDLLRQAEIYRSVVRVCRQIPRCTAIQTWGFTDKYSWIGSHSRGARGAALPFDKAYAPKPAYGAILDELSARRRPGGAIALGHQD
jgi:endo-1,4-beta-xylanase